MGLRFQHIFFCISTFTRSTNNSGSQEFQRPGCVTGEAAWCRLSPFNPKPCHFYDLFPIPNLNTLGSFGLSYPPTISVKNPNPNLTLTLTFDLSTFQAQNHVTSRISKGQLIPLTSLQGLTRLYTTHMTAVLHLVTDFPARWEKCTESQFNQASALEQLYKPG